jgi:hypothetical protein
MSSLLERRLTQLAGLRLPLRNKVRAILLAVDGARCLATMPLAPISNLVCVVSHKSISEDDAFDASTPDVYAALREHIAQEWDCEYTWILVPRLAHYSARKPSRASIDGPSPQAIDAQLDPHRVTAARMLNIPESDVTEAQRMKFKNVNLAAIYGASDETLRRMAGEPDAQQFTRVRDDEALDFKDTFIPSLPVDGAK